MKRIVLTLICAMAIGQLYAQKLTVKSGKIKDLAEFKSYKVEYIYSDDMKVGKKTEQEYLEEKRLAKNDDEPGKGDEFVADWHEPKENGRYAAKFEKLMNDALADHGVNVASDNENADCTIKLLVHYMDPGFNVGVTRRPAYISTIATFESNGEEVAVVHLEKAPGQDAAGFDYDHTYRIEEGFAKTGKTLGKTMSKQAYK